MMIVSVYTAAGLLGAAVSLFAYTALQAGFLRGQGYYYAGLNAIGAGLVLYSLQEAFNMSSALMQVAWISISAFGIGRYFILTHTSRFTTEEADFLEATVPGLERIDARRLLDLGEWRDPAAGTRLTEAGTVNENVYYLLRGEAEVHSGSTLIARLDAHTFVGDMGLVSGGPATATVTVVEPARVLVLPVAPLKRLMERNADVRRHLKAALSGHLVGKLLGTSRDLADARQAAPG